MTKKAFNIKVQSLTQMYLWSILVVTKGYENLIEIIIKVSVN